MALRIRSRPSSPADTLATTPPRGLVYVSMGSERHEEGARAWIAENLQSSVRASSDPDVRVYAGGQPRRMSPYEFTRLVRKLKIFAWLDRLEFGSFLDLPRASSTSRTW